MSKLQHNQKAGVYGKLQEFLPQLVERYNPEKIICFGCLSTSEIYSSCFMEPFSDNTAHYFLLMVCPHTYRVEHNAQDYCTTHFNHGEITLLSHTAEAVADAIASGNPFFIKVIKDGLLLYSSDGIVINTTELPEIDPVGTLNQAEKYAHHHINMSRGFMRSAKECITQGYYKNGLFLMHQALEQMLMGLIRVHTAYRCDIHLISRLLNFCKCFSSKPGAIFPRNTDGEKRMFKLIQEGYNSSRYSSTFEVDAEDVQILFQQVNRLLDLASVMCEKKIQQLTKAAQEAAAATCDYGPALPVAVHS